MNHLHPPVNLSEAHGVRYLHLGTEWVQGAMEIKHPNRLYLEYIQRMMAWLLWTDKTQMKHLHSLQLGLGAAALTKFNLLNLNINTYVVEINPNVVSTAFQWFKLPKHHDRLNVVLDDAQMALQNPDWFGLMHSIQIDLYDHEAAAPVLNDITFYQNVRACLTDKGMITVNLFGHQSHLKTTLSHLEAVFGCESGHLWVFQPTKDGNTIVLASVQALTWDWLVLQHQAEWIETTYQLPASRWLKALRSREDFYRNF